MRAIFVLFDSLNLRALQCYGGTTVETPNFDRLAARGITFDNHYVGSMPCMPARRDLMTGRLNFLHRSWGPLEPYDRTWPSILGKAGVHTHLVTDHYHYFEDGGATYHGRYSTWDLVRGQEADKWKGVVAPDLATLKTRYHPVQFETDPHGFRYQNLVNRDFIRHERDFPMRQTFDRGLEFIDTNHEADGWVLQLETFDPHEPFTAPERFRDRYRTNYVGPILDWPRYREVTESPDEVAELRANYAALVAYCDEQLGRLLDRMDALGLWDDTLLILTTDHGFMLGEHDWWGKNRMPFYDEIARIPLIVWHPDHAGQAGTRRKALTQNIDIMPTLLEAFGQPCPEEVRGHSLLPLLARDGAVREAAIFGIFGGSTNVTDGRHTCFRYPADPSGEGLFEYTLMPVHMHDFFAPAEFEAASLVSTFDFTRGMPVMRLPARKDASRPPMQGGGFAETETVLYDTHADPGQASPIRDEAIEARLVDGMVRAMRAHDAPPEAYSRLGLSQPSPKEAA